MNRRQELLRDAGNYASVRDYERAREAGAPLAAAAVAVRRRRRVQRAAQPASPTSPSCSCRSAGSAARSACTCCSPRSGWRRAGCAAWTPPVLPDRAAHVLRGGVARGARRARRLRAAGRARPRLPQGRHRALRRFKAAYVSGAVPPRATADGRGVQAGAEVRRFTAPYQAGTVAAAPGVDARRPNGAGRRSTTPGSGSPEDDRARRRWSRQLVGQGPPAHQVWLPPLDEPPRSTSCCPPLGAPARGRGFGPRTRRAPAAAGPGRRGRPAVRAAPRPAVGRPRPAPAATSRSSAVRSSAKVDAAAQRSSARSRCTHTPAEVQFYCLDFGGGGLFALGELPHVGGVAGRQDARRGAPHRRRGRPRCSTGASRASASSASTRWPRTGGAACDRRGRRRPVRRRVPASSTAGAVLRQEFEDARGRRHRPGRARADASACTWW